MIQKRTNTYNDMSNEVYEKRLAQEQAFRDWVNADKDRKAKYEIRSVEPCLDQEAVRVIKLMPKWKPGKQRGRVIRTLFRVPITFKFKE